MKKNLFFAVAALLAFAQGAWAQETIEGLEYVGSQSDGYYEIKSVAHLNALATYVNADNDCSGKTFKMTANITFGSSDEFTPIGMGDESGGTSFNGTFDGGGFTISGINYSAPEEIGVGLFGYIYSPAVIKNVTLDNSSFTGNYEVGAIVGASYGASDNSPWGIYDCTVGSGVTVQAVIATIDGEEYPGAFAGGIIGSCVNMTLRNCVSAATVTGDELVGGITGRLLSSISGISTGSERGIIDNCYFTGTANGSPTPIGHRGPSDYDGEGTEGQVCITLFTDDSAESINNATRIDNYEGQVCDVTLSGRTLYKDKSWNTLCLPFAVTISGSVLEGATVKTLSSSSYSNDKLTLTFTDATSIEAGKPYIVMWEERGSDISNPVFNEVKIVSETADVTTESVDFKGCFAPVALTAGDKSMLYMGSDNKLYYPSANFNINAFRGYFELKGITAGDLTAGANISIVLNFSDETSGIENLQSSILDLPSAAWYTLDGRLINGRPTAKGVYINNGRKVIIK